MSNTTIEDEMITAMHEFVEDYCDSCGEPGDANFYHEMIDSPLKRQLNDGRDCEPWLCFQGDFQEYLSNQ